MSIRITDPSGVITLGTDSSFTDSIPLTS